jgi:hypothetical protein
MSTTQKTAMEMGDGVNAFPGAAGPSSILPKITTPAWMKAIYNNASALGQEIYNNAPSLSSYNPRSANFGAPAAPAAAHLKAVGDIETKIDKNVNEDLGKAIVQYGLGGLGVGIGAAGLYHLLGAVNKAKPKYKKVGPGAQTVDEEEKIAADPAAPAPYSVEALMSQIGKLVPKGHFDNMLPSLGGASIPDYDAGRKGWTTAALLGTTGLGLYGGAALMNSMAEKKKKEDMQEEVAAAKAQYQRALFGKSSEALDAAYAQFEKVSEPQQGSAVADVLNTPFRLMGPAFGPYLAAVLGSGALASKLTYDWTRARGRDKALQAAQKSRARLNGVAPVYIDPEQMASLKSLAN